MGARQRVTALMERFGDAGGSRRHPERDDALDRARLDAVASATGEGGHDVTPVGPAVGRQREHAGDAVLVEDPMGILPYRYRLELRRAPGRTRPAAPVPCRLGVVEALRLGRTGGSPRDAPAPGRPGPGLVHAAADVGAT